MFEASRIQQEYGGVFWDEADPNAIRKKSPREGVWVVRLGVQMIAKACVIKAGCSQFHGRGHLSAPLPFHPPGPIHLRHATVKGRVPRLPAVWWGTSATILMPGLSARSEAL